MMLMSNDTQVLCKMRTATQIQLAIDYIKVIKQAFLW